MNPAETTLTQRAMPRPIRAVAWSSRAGSERPAFCVCIALTAMTLLVYWPAAGYGFVNFDDPLYVTQNRHVLAGLSMGGVAWAFSSVKWFYHPITWLSLMVDAQLFGLHAGGYHLTNVWLHVLNVALLFIALREMTGSLWPSALAAALFAVHPINVETVAWISERKGVLSTFFFLCALWAYARYATGGSRLAYASSVAAFLLGTLSKPMLVTFPFVLLLLDLWPLRRLRFERRGEAATCSARPFRPGELRWLLLEKLPYLVIAASIVPLTIVAERNGGALNPASSAGIRLANAVLSYAGYVGKLLWPDSLAVSYPYREVISPWAVAGAAFLLTATTAAAVWQWRRRPYLAVGWLLFGGTLVPVIGLIRVGFHCMADRYAYVPEIGLWICVAWAASDLLAACPQARPLCLLLAGAALAAAGVRTRNQLATWRDSITLFDQAIRVAPSNFVAHVQLGVALATRRALGEAELEFREALAIYPGSALCQADVARVLAAQGRFAESIPYYRLALASRALPDLAGLRAALSAALAGEKAARNTWASNAPPAVSLLPFAWDDGGGSP